VIAALALLAFGGAIDECPAALDFKGPKVVPAAQSYADCMSRPHLPTAAELVERKKQCAAKRLKGESAEQTVAWVDQVATGLPGCETRLKIVRP